MAKSKSSKSKPQSTLTKADLVGAGCPEVLGRGILLHPRTFSTGSYGFSSNAKIVGEVNGQPVTYQVGVNVIGYHTNPTNALAKGKTPALSKDEFEAKTVGLLVAFDDCVTELYKHQGKPSKQGSINFFVNGKANIVIDGKTLQCSVNMNVTACGSANLPDAIEVQAE